MTRRGRARELSSDFCFCVSEIVRGQNSWADPRFELRCIATKRQYYRLLIPLICWLPRTIISRVPRALWCRSDIKAANEGRAIAEDLRGPSSDRAGLQIRHAGVGQTTKGRKGFARSQRFAAMRW